MPLEVKKAVELARGYMADLLQVPVAEILLEEVERNGSFWNITFSYPDPAPATIRNMLGGGRTYKVVKLDAVTGDFISVKIRSVAYEQSA